MVRPTGLPSRLQIRYSAHQSWEVPAVEGLMQDYELSLQHVLWRIERLHPKKEVVTKLEQGVHRTTNGDMVPRINRLAGALKRLGVKPGDRVATLAWNNYRHLELYYAVPCMGAVLHTLNVRLYPEQLAYVINDAGDRVVLLRCVPATVCGMRAALRSRHRGHSRAVLVSRATCKRSALVHHSPTVPRAGQATAMASLRACRIVKI